MYSSTTSSEEDEAHIGSFHRHGTTRSKKSKGRRGHRKTRSQNTLQDDLVSDKYLESLISTSLTDREKAHEAK